jgi:hypothetical protein
MIKAPKPEDITKILYEIDQADADGSQYVQRKLRNWNTRFCIWPGQSEDGRKWSGAQGKQPWPWSIRCSRSACRQYHFGQHGPPLQRLL